jgi:predicted SnoaL-like aldol condensation-catalyzing enzyme
MHIVQFLFLAALPLAVSGSQQLSVDLPNCTTDLTHDNHVEACLQEPYCPGREVDERLQGEIFARFLEVLYGEKNASKAFETYVDPKIIEHDPDDTQDRDAIVARLSQIIPFADFTILASNFNNNIGLAHLKVNEDPEPAALADIYRMEGTCIVEHWDVIQYRPADSTNPIAMF